MSLKIDLETSSKKEIAKILHGIAEMIENSYNNSISINLAIEFKSNLKAK